MKTVYYLKNCGTNKKIMAPLDLSGWNLREIKTEPITEEELDEMHKMAGSYEALFSRKSSQIKARGIDLKSLKEKDYKKLLLEHYTFLKRPVFITDQEIFIGNDKSNLEKLNEFFEK